MNEEAYSLSNLTHNSHLIRAIQRRNQALQRIAEYITQNQREFLKEGFSKLKPLTIEKLAKDLGMHKSTMSRAIANKYIETYEGVFRLKDLFARPIKTENGNLSTKAIKEIIKDIIKNEGKLNPLTDQTIKEHLSRQGINISRRAVTKYRNQLKILPSYLRK